MGFDASWKVISRAPRWKVVKYTYHWKPTTRPLEPDHQAVAKADQEHEMQHQPHEPGHKTGQAQLPNRDDAIETSYHGHIAFIDVAEGLGVWFASDPVSNDGSAILSLLDRDLSNSRQRLAILGKTGRIPNDKDVGMPWDRRIAADLDTAPAVRLGTQPLTGRGCCHPCRPDDRFGGKTFSRDHDALTVDRFDG